MPEQVFNVFTEYNFSEDELAQIVFSPVQIMFLRTEVSKYAMQKMGIAAGGPEFTTIEDFMKSHAKFEGAMEAIQYIINYSEHLNQESERVLRERHRQEEFNEQFNFAHRVRTPEPTGDV